MSCPQTHSALRCIVTCCSRPAQTTPSALFLPCCLAAPCCRAMLPRGATKLRRSQCAFHSLRCAAVLRARYATGALRSLHCARSRAGARRTHSVPLCASPHTPYAGRMQCWALQNGAARSYTDEYKRRGIAVCGRAFAGARVKRSRTTQSTAASERNSARDSACYIRRATPTHALADVCNRICAKDFIRASAVRTCIERGQPPNR